MGKLLQALVGAWRGQAKAYRSTPCFFNLGTANLLEGGQQALFQGLRVWLQLYFIFLCIFRPEHVQASPNFFKQLRTERRVRGKVQVWVFKQDKLLGLVELGNDHSWLPEAEPQSFEFDVAKIKRRQIHRP